MRMISSITNGPRQSNMELLRIIAMFLVLVVHADFWALGGPTAEDFSLNPLSAVTRTIIESISIVCVNVFILISGWFGIKPSLKGFCNFVFQCAFFLFGIYAIMLVTGYAQLSYKGIAGCLCLTSANWFIRAYVGLYILAPILNTFIDKSSKRTIELFLITFFIFQTIWGWSGAAKFFEQGYSTFSFIGLYILARYTRQYANKKLSTWGGHIYVFSVIANTILYFFLRKVGMGIDAYSYINPIVIIASLGLILHFSNLKVGHSKVINWIAKSSFGVFLIHSNPNISESIFKALMINVYESYNGIICVVVSFLVLSGVYVLGTLFDQPRKWLWELIFSRFISK